MSNARQEEHIEVAEILVQMKATRETPDLLPINYKEERLPIKLEEEKEMSSHHGGTDQDGSWAVPKNTQLHQGLSIRPLSPQEETSGSSHSINAGGTTTLGGSSNCNIICISEEQRKKALNTLQAINFDNFSEVIRGLGSKRDRSGSLPSIPKRAAKRRNSVINLNTEVPPDSQDRTRIRRNDGLNRPNGLNHASKVFIVMKNRTRGDFTITSFL